MLSAKLTDLSGSSQYFNGGVVCYSNALKRDIVGVDSDLLDKYGAVSEEIASELASKIAKKLNASVKELDGVYNVWWKIYEKYRKKDRS